MISNKHEPCWKPVAEPGVLQARAELLTRVRRFFAERGVLEVETPALSRAGNSDPGLQQFSTRDPSLWLRTSPEYAMKRLLAAGSGDIYELGRVFRKGESGRNHNIEFTMLEWYRQGWTYHQLMDEAAELVHYCLPECALRVSRVSYARLFRAHTGLDALGASDIELADLVQARGFDMSGLSRNEMLDLLLTHVVQPGLPDDGLTLVFDYPAAQAALARIRHEDPPVAERFELFLGRTELANGYQELTDAAEQEERFRRENREREHGGRSPVPVDENLLAALQSGLPECAGVALGFDRLLMFKLGLDSLAQALAFPGSIA